MELREEAREVISIVLSDLEHLGLIEVSQDRFMLTPKGVAELMKGAARVAEEGRVEDVFRAAEGDEEMALIGVMVGALEASLTAGRLTMGLPGHGELDDRYICGLTALSKVLLDSIPSLREGLRMVLKGAGRR